jgi:hypothetical protein
LECGIGLKQKACVELSENLNTNFVMTIVEFVVHVRITATFQLGTHDHTAKFLLALGYRHYCKSNNYWRNGNVSVAGLFI